MSRNRIRKGYLVGIALIGLGVMIVLKGGFRHLGHYVNFFGYHVQFGIILIIIGAFFLFTALRNPKKRKVMKQK
jgi:drug/metabolite transporter (DMT)-like permease